MVCSERNFNDLISILAIPVGSLTWAYAAARLAQTVATSDYTLPNSGTVYIGRMAYRSLGAAHTPQYTIPMTAESGEVKDEESLELGGRLHKVSVKFETGAESMSARDALRRLENGEWALELCFFGDVSGQPVRAIVQATRDTCIVSSKRDGKKISVSIDIENLTGVQIVGNY